MAQKKEKIKTPEKELSNEKIDNLSDSEFKTLIIRMLTELIEFSCKLREEMNAIQTEIKQNIQETNSERKETRTQINDLVQKEEINIQPGQNEERRIQKNEERLNNLWDNFKLSNIQIIGMPEGEEKEEQTENLFEKIMKGNFPNLVKEIDFQEVQEAQRFPKNWTPRGTHQGTS